MNLRQVLMLGGVVVAGWLALFGDKTPASGIAEPVKRTASAATPKAASAPAHAARNDASGAGSNGNNGEPAIILSLQDRDTFIWNGRGAHHASNLFNSQSWTPPPPPPPKVEALPPPPPMAPPLSFTYLGKKIEDGAWEVYLARGDRTFIVHANSVIESTYRVDAIAPPILSLTYLPLNQVQRLTIGGND